MQNLNAFEQGFNTAMNNGSKLENPYPVATTNHYDWLDGFSEGLTEKDSITN